MSSRNRNEREKRTTNLEAWIPKTRLGKMIQEGKITSIEDVFLSGIKISESQIVDSLIPDLQEEVINVNLVQKQTDAGEKSRFKAIVAVGNRDGYVGLGSGKASQVRNAIEKAAVNARLNIIPVKRGCGSWECGCGKPHSVPFRSGRQMRRRPSSHRSWPQRLRLGFKRSRKSHLRLSRC